MARAGAWQDGSTSPGSCWPGWGLAATSMAVTRAALDSARRALDAGQDYAALTSYVADRDRV